MKLEFDGVLLWWGLCGLLNLIAIPFLYFNIIIIVKLLLWSAVTWAIAFPIIVIIYGKYFYHPITNCNQSDEKG